MKIIRPTSVCFRMSRVEEKARFDTGYVESS